MKKGEIVFSLFLPTNQDPTGAIKPTMSAFHYPAPCAMTGGKDFLLLLRATAANMRDIVAVLHPPSPWGSLLCRLPTKVLRPPPPGPGARQHHAIPGGTYPCQIMTAW